MSDDKTDIVTVVIEPLAERLEAASKAAHPAGKVSSATLDMELMRSHLKQAAGYWSSPFRRQHARCALPGMEGPDERTGLI